MKSIRELEGTIVSMLIPALNPKTFQKVTVHKVEDVGVWIECQATTEKILESRNVTMAPKAMVLFFPWPSVTMIMDSINVPSISDSVL